MTARSLTVLRALAAASTWARPMDVGGADGSHHSRTLRRLYAAGLVERRPRGTLANHIYQVSGSRAVASWEYRVTEVGMRSAKFPVDNSAARCNLTASRQLQKSQ